MSRIHELLKQQEGTGPIDNGNHMPYRDSEGLLTIGYGICIERTGLRPNEAEYLLRCRVSEAEEECFIQLDWFADLDETRQDVIVNMVFNLGMPTFKKFELTIGCMERGDYENASIEMLDSKWAKQVGDRAKHLSKIMLTGGWL